MDHTVTLSIARLDKDDEGLPFTLIAGNGIGVTNYTIYFDDVKTGEATTARIHTRTD